MSESFRADPAPFFLQGGDVGLLLVQGFTGSPSELRPLGHYLHKQGLTVAAPLLPGHGTSPEDLNRYRRQDWIDHVEDAWHELSDRCTTVFAAGLSLGALLSIMLAARRASLAGIILYSPAIRVTDPRGYVVALLKYLTPQVSKPTDFFAEPSAQALMWAYSVYPTAAAHEAIRLMADAKRALPMVRCPVLTIYSRADTTLHPSCAQTIHDGVGSTERDIIVLQKSGHVVTVDCEWEQVAQETWQFIQRHAPSEAERKKA